MRKGEALLLSVIISTFVIAVLYLALRADLAINPWLTEVQYKWWNLFTTKHYLSWALYYHARGAHIFIVVVWVLGTLCGFYSFKR